jgi:hypothetical protein
VGGELGWGHAGSGQQADGLSAAGYRNVEPGQPAPVDVELHRVLRGDPHRVGEQGQRAGDGDRLRFHAARRQRDAAGLEERVDVMARRGADIGDDKRILEHRKQGQAPGAVGRKRMLRPGHDGERLGVEQLERDALHQRGLGHPPDGEIDLTRSQRREQLRVSARAHRYPGIGAARVQVRDRLREQAAGHRWQRGHQCGRETGRRGRGEGGGGRLKRPRDVNRVPQELLAGPRQLGARPSPLDQLPAGQPLKLGQRLRDRGLAEMEPVRGTGEGALLSDGHETAEVPQTDTRQCGCCCQRSAIIASRREIAPIHNHKLRMCDQ